MRLVGLLALLAACGAGHTPVPSYPPLTSAKHAPVDSESDVKVTLFRLAYRFEPDGTYTSTLHDTYEILTQGGVEGWDATEARWSPWHMDRPVIKASVRSPGGATSALEPAALAESAAYPDAPEMYGDERVLRGPLPNVAVGSVIDEEISTHVNRPFPERAEAHGATFQVSVPRTRVELVVDVPDPMPLRWEIRDAKVDVTDVRQGGRRVVTFAGGPYEAIKAPEPSLPSTVVQWPHVNFTTGTTWNAVAKAYARVVADKTADANLEGVVAGVVSPSDPPAARMAKLLGWLRDRVRYVGIEFGDSSIVPRAPAETLRHGYGDCKDQAVLLVALLRAAGLSPRVALLDSGYGQDIDTTLPALNVFNHAIVVVPGASPVWIDPTATRARAGELPGPDAGRYALVVDDDSDALVRTPVPTAAGNTYREVRKVTFADDGGAHVVESASATGAIERGLREGFDSSGADRTKWLKDYASRTYSSDAPVRIDTPKVDDLSTPFTTLIEVDDASVAAATLLASSMSVVPGVVFGWLPKALTGGGDERQNDLALQPYQAELVYELHPGAGFVMDDPPDLHDVPLGPAVLRRKLETRKDGAVVVTYQLAVPTTVWSAADVNAFRKAYDAFAPTDAPIVAFSHQGQKLHKAREYEKELAAYRAEVRDHPQSGIATMRLAQAVLGLGYGTTARKLAEQATRLSPGAAWAWEYKGYILSHDTLGRWFHAGWDPDGAVEAYRQAMRLDPGSVFDAVHASNLLEYDAAAHRYGAGSHLADALATLDAIEPDKLAAYEHGEWVGNALFDLFWLGRYDEVAARAAKLDPKKVTPVPVIAAAGMLGGPNAGLSAATRLALPDDSRATTLTGAADALVALRKYPEGVALLSAVASGSADEALRRRIESIKKTRPIEPASLPVGTPENVARKFVAVCMLHGPTMKDDVRPLVSRRDAEGSSDPTVAGMCKGLGYQLPDRTVPRAVLADIVYANLELHSEGKDAVGYRLKATSFDSKYELYVVKEGGAYQIRAMGFPADLGCEALSMLKAGRKDAAVQWLTWAREPLSPAAGDDPLRDMPFARLWKDKADDAEVGAAALCASDGHADAVVAPLLAARAQASGDRATAIDHALTIAYSRAHRDAETLATATQLGREAPTSNIAWAWQVHALAQLGRFQALRDAAAARLAASPDSAERLDDLALAESLLGRFAEAHAVGERAVAKQGTAPAYNAQAWRSLFVGNVTERDVGYSLKAVNLAPSSAAYLNTLAALDITTGHTADARERIVRVLELRKEKEPTDDDWFVIGRIAEQLGLPDEAKAAYGKIAPPDKASGQYTLAHLVQARMRALP